MLPQFRRLSWFGSYARDRLLDAVIREGQVILEQPDCTRAGRKGPR